MCPAYGRSFGRSEHQEAKSVFLPGRMLFLFVSNACVLSAWIPLLFTAPTEVEPDKGLLTPLHLVSMLFPLPHPLPSSASLCLLVFVEVPWHYNFKEIQRMEVISPTSWMNTERNQDEKGVLQSHALLLWGYRQKINLEGIIRSALQRYKGQQRCKHHIFFSSPPPSFKVAMAAHRTSTRKEAILFKKCFYFLKAAHTMLDAFMTV